ncbi:hypothetical protein NE236_04175 [Actinoallomurus purpureus]|nr:hypothetical protein [Actinoallomurus purpureus]MCO6004168.1 hypothetical protein [Actinoallomurus purpureus]
MVTVSLLLPGAGHKAIGTAAVTENLLWHQARFLQRHLDAPSAGPCPAPR